MRGLIEELEREGRAEEITDLAYELKGLETRARNWSVTGPGEDYLSSSALGKNQPSGDRPMYDTTHDISNVADFRDWMDSRSTQAKALRADMVYLQDYTAAYMDVYDEAPDLSELANNYAERFMMAMYGTDITKHGPDFDAYGSAEWDFAVPERKQQIAEKIMSGDMSGLMKQLEDFSKDWEQIEGYENEELAKPGTFKVARVDAKVGRQGSNEQSFIATVDFLERYVAENQGRNEYFSRLYGHSNKLYPEAGVEVSIDPACESAVESSRLETLFELCKNEHGEIGNGPDDDAYPLDGASLVRRLNTVPQYEYQPPVRYAEEAVRPEPGYDRAGVEPGRGGQDVGFGVEVAPRFVPETEPAPEFGDGRPEPEIAPAFESGDIGGVEAAPGEYDDKHERESGLDGLVPNDRDRNVSVPNVTKAAPGKSGVRSHPRVERVVPDKGASTRRRAMDDLDAAYGSIVEDGHGAEAEDGLSL